MAHEGQSAGGGGGIKMAAIVSAFVTDSSPAASWMSRSMPSAIHKGTTRMQKQEPPDYPFQNMGAGQQEHLRQGHSSFGLSNSRCIHIIALSLIIVKRLAAAVKKGVNCFASACSSNTWAEYSAQTGYLWVQLTI